MAIRTSIGTSTANSYVSVASANSYFQYAQNADGWNNISNNTNGTAATGQKEDLLKRATREIDKNFRFNSDKYYDGELGQTNYQALKFPRDENLDADNNLYIPDEVKYATYEQALWIEQRGGIKPNPETGYEFISRTIGKKAYEYLKGWINRQVCKSGSWEWQGSSF